MPPVQQISVGDLVQFMWWDETSSDWILSPTPYIVISSNGSFAQVLHQDGPRQVPVSLLRRISAHSACTQR